MNDVNYNEVVSSIVEAVVKYLHKEDKFDHTMKMRVTKVCGNKKYKVTFHGGTYTVISQIGLAVGDFVWVCAPENNWDNLFVVAKS